MDFYEGLMSKVLDKLQSWKGKLLSIGGWAVLIAHVLQSIPVHFNSVDGRARHWASWDTLCLPNEEGGALYFVTPTDFFCDETTQNVYDVVNGGGWDYVKLYDLLPEEFSKHILDNIAPPTSSNIMDKPIWNMETKGTFSTKTAWEYLRKRKGTTITYKNMWVKGLSFKISFFMWKGRLPLDDAIKRMGYRMASKCWCCVKPREETVAYVFFTSYAAKKMARCSKYDGNYLPTLKFNKVTYEFPLAGWIKINTDGASRGNLGRSSIGYCIRNDNGDLVYVVGKEMKETTNTQAETRAILEALRYCTIHHTHQIWLETDSMLRKNTIEGNWKPHWIIEEEVEEINELLTGGNGRVSHIYREGNKLADHLANYALDMGNLECHEFH
ncbi:uncharacterized protein LOC142181808 [Nicotiana tabacum]|uniref:Uncharacterized protein LOC142181808 n=1 Tax=Nicotiana tabacum TaxID=4097 RepID=A0AC58UPP6_TOBAC